MPVLSPGSKPGTIYPKPGASYKGSYTNTPNEDVIDLLLIENKLNSFIYFYYNKPGYIRRNYRSLKEGGKGEG